MLDFDSVFSSSLGSSKPDSLLRYILSWDSLRQPECVIITKVSSCLFFIAIANKFDPGRSGGRTLPQPPRHRRVNGTSSRPSTHPTLIVYEFWFINHSVLRSPISHVAMRSISGHCPKMSIAVDILNHFGPSHFIANLSTEILLEQP